MQKLVQDSVRGWSPQVVFVDSWLMAQYLPAGLRRPQAAARAQRRVRALGPAGRARIRPAQVRWPRARPQRVRKYEQDTLARFDVVFAVSEDDRRSLRELGADPDRLRILPNIPDRALLDLPSLAFEQHRARRPLPRHAQLAAKHRRRRALRLQRLPDRPQARPGVAADRRRPRRTEGARREGRRHARR